MNRLLLLPLLLPLLSAWPTTAVPRQDAPNTVALNGHHFTLPPGFTGFWGSIEQATTPTPEFRNCIVVVNREGKAIEAWTQWDYLFADGRGIGPALVQERSEDADTGDAVHDAADDPFPPGHESLVRPWRLGANPCAAG